MEKITKKDLREKYLADELEAIKEHSCISKFEKFLFSEYIIEDKPMETIVDEMEIEKNFKSLRKMHYAKEKIFTRVAKYLKRWYNG